MRGGGTGGRGEEGVRLEGLLVRVWMLRLGTWREVGVGGVGGPGGGGEGRRVVGVGT